MKHIIYLFCFHIFTGRCGHGSPCVQLCYELHDGMYECDCEEGYELDKNGYSCQGKFFQKKYFSPTRRGANQDLLPLESRSVVARDPPLKTDPVL